MAEIIAELLDREEIPKYLSGVMDIEGEPDVDAIDADAGGWIGIGDDGISISETGSNSCLIKYELWNEPPPPLDGWDRAWTGNAHLSSGRVCSVNQSSGDVSYGQEFDLGHRDRDWQVRIYRKALSHDEFTANIVSFTLLKIQFWLRE